MGGQVKVGQPSLTAQHPLLDGGEGELLPRRDDMELNAQHNEQSNLSGLEPPSLDSTGGVVTGADTPKHRIENKHR
jgi:hypothetical protein